MCSVFPKIVSAELMFIMCMKMRQKVCLYAERSAWKGKKGPTIVCSISHSCLFSVVSCACVAWRWAVEGSRKCMNHEGMCLCWTELILTSQRENTHHGPVLSPSLHLQSVLLVFFFNYYYFFTKEKPLWIISCSRDQTSHQNIEIIELCRKQNVLRKVKRFFVV